MYILDILIEVIDYGNIQTLTRGETLSTLSELVTRSDQLRSKLVLPTIRSIYGRQSPNLG